MSSPTKTVLIVGARGYVGSQVVDSVLKSNKYAVKVLIRPNSKFEERTGVEVVRGDLMDAPSLVTACEGVDAVINTANGYMQGHPEIDVEGANNLVDACKTCQVKRYIYCSVLTCDKAPDVEHFHHKYLHEEYAKKTIPSNFIALRPGAFLDQATDFLGDGIKRGDWFALSVWDKTVPLGFVYTPDLADYFCQAIELPEDANGNFIEIGWSRPVSFQEIVGICSTKLDRSIKCLGLGWFIRVGLIYSVGFFMPLVKEILRMFNYIGRGGYVNSTQLQEQYFGKPPTPEDAVGRYVDRLLEEKAKSEEKAEQSEEKAEQSEEKAEQSEEKAQGDSS